MRLLYCWRCRTEVPMFDAAEYAALGELISGGMQATKGFRREHGLPPGALSLEERFRPMSQLHEQMTGLPETNPNAVGHHLLSLYGPPCKRCGKPLRTPRARFCAACGQKTNMEAELAAV